MRDPEEELSELESAGLRRRLRRIESPQGRSVALTGTRECLNFSSNDYLGLANSEELKSLYQIHIGKLGAGSGASRLVCGTMAAHLELEEKLADLKNSPAALTFSSGFAAATGIIQALCGKDDFVILDKLCHASLIDGARLSGAAMRVYPHNDLERLASHLRWAETKRGRNSRVLVITESVFSMDGDLAPLAGICDLKDTHDSLLLVDEAHAFGVLGPQGRGLAASLGLEKRVDLQMGTFSKAAGLSGGYLCASRPLVDLMTNRARSFIYSTAPSPALAATIRDGLDLVCGTRGEELRTILFANRERFLSGTSSAIVPMILGDNHAALSASATLQDMGFLVPAIRYPTVPRGSARLRFTLSAAHYPDDIEALKKALAEVIPDRYDSNFAS
ncbi:MAG: 8-amino-7-oxononanoate synthase [Verrucomicrobiae bacterium]|nr:8-amino-7-oxononanoate synthase [Verrucomicrobiae bacterium]